MAASTPKYKIGDFVRCTYDLIDFYFYLYEDNDYSYFKYYGIIIDVAYEETWYDMEAVYKVYCMDGCFRFFLEDEILLV
tara:strand:- start:150 stop:386 length:237 start_codon:yes stop_codon:yes gene_type:complete